MRAWYADTAHAHAAADRNCGRAWACACGPCAAARQAGWAPAAPRPMPDKKIDTLRAHMAAGRWEEALRLANTFPRLGDHKATITRGWEAYARPEWLTQLKRDPEAAKAAAIAALKEMYDAEV